MTPKELAKNYLRFWYVLDDHSCALADNAPKIFAHFVKELPASTDKQLVFQALEGIATGKFPAVPQLPALFVWFSKFSGAVSNCDAVLADKSPPKTMATLLRAAYTAELNSIRATVQNWLVKQIE